MIPKTHWNLRPGEREGFQPPAGIVLATVPLGLTASAHCPGRCIALRRPVVLVARGRTGALSATTSGTGALAKPMVALAASGL